MRILTTGIGRCQKIFTQMPSTVTIQRGLDNQINSFNRGPTAKSSSSRVNRQNDEPASSKAIIKERSMGKAAPNQTIGPQPTSFTRPNN